MTKKPSKKTKPAKKIESGTYTYVRKNQTDLTLRNLRALKRTVALLAADVGALDANWILLNERLERVERLWR